MRNLELSYELNGSYATSFSTDQFLNVDYFLYFKDAFKKRGVYSPFLFLFSPVFLLFFVLSRPELCCSLSAPVPRAMEMKRLSVEHITFAVCLKVTIKQVASSRVVLLYWCYCRALCYGNQRSCTLWSWSGAEGQRTPRLLFGTSPAAAGALPERVFIQHCGESRVPCSTKATSSSLPMNHCSLRGLATIPGPPEGWSHCLLSGIRIKSRGALLLEPGTWHPSKELSGDLIGHVIQRYRTKQGKDPSHREGRKEERYCNIQRIHLRWLS